MKRFGWVGQLRAECVEKYVQLHAHAWPEVLARNTSCHLRNYSIYYQQMPGGVHLLFSYVEYTGEDFAADMQRMAADPQVQRWWDECKPCFVRFDDLAEGEVWMPMTQVFHQS